MKKIISLLILLFVGVQSYSQEATISDNEDTKAEKEFNQFSIEANVGFNKPDDNFTPGYYSSDPASNFPLNNIRHFDLGVRYMFNERFGLKLDGSYDLFEPESQSSGSLPFETKQYRLGLQGVANLRNILNFNSFSNRLGLLAHFGIQASIFKPESRNNISLGDSERNGGFIFGLTPQYKLSDKVVLTADATFIQNYRSHLAWDGVINPQNNLKSSLLNVSLGLTVYLGEHDEHADWVDDSVESLYEDRVNELETKVAKIENDMQDTDKDGVPDYLDRQPNTTSGVAVNTKGESVDNNRNGIPDELERSLEKMYVTKQFATENYSMSGIDDVKPDANDFLINVYFRFDSTQPEYYSLNSIDRIVRYMKKYPNEEAVLTGYTDQIGNEAYNKKLSEDRAKKVYDIVIASGIDESRLTYKGGGIDDSKDPKSGEARQLSRRVSFELK